MPRIRCCRATARWPNRSLDEMIAGARVDVAPYKRDATDFVLWKPSKPGEPSWPSPAGITARGVRAGTSSARRWRGSISASSSTFMAAASIWCFRTTRTKSRNRAAPSMQRRMANFWMHNGFLQVEGDKMSKSLGNFVTIRELLADWPGEVLRLNMLKTHYRSPIDWTLKGVEESAKTLDDWYCGRRGRRRRAAVRCRDRGAVGRPEHAADDRRVARPAQQCGVRQRTGSRRVCRFAAASRFPVRDVRRQWKGRKQQASGVDAGADRRL